jgi:hypothetical protein
MSADVPAGPGVPLAVSGADGSAGPDGAAGSAGSAGAPGPAGAVRAGDLLEGTEGIAPDRLALGFVAALRAAGVSVSLGASMVYLEALRIVGFDRLEHVRLAGRTTLITDQADLARYDAVFDAYWFAEPEPSDGSRASRGRPARGTGRSDDTDKRSEDGPEHHAGAGADTDAEMRDRDESAGPRDDAARAGPRDDAAPHGRAGGQPRGPDSPGGDPHVVGSGEVTDDGPDGERVAVDRGRRDAPFVGTPDAPFVGTPDGTDEERLEAGGGWRVARASAVDVVRAKFFAAYTDADGCCATCASSARPGGRGGNAPSCTGTVGSTCAARCVTPGVTVARCCRSVPPERRTARAGSCSCSTSVVRCSPTNGVCSGWRRPRWPTGPTGRSRCSPSVPD